MVVKNTIYQQVSPEEFFSSKRVIEGTSSYNVNLLDVNRLIQIVKFDVIYLFIYLFIYLLFIHLFIYIFIYLFRYLFIIYLFIHLFTYLFLLLGSS